MPTYTYKGRNRLNEMVSGEREAANQDELRSLLKREQVIMTQASEKGKRRKNSENWKEEKESKIERFSGVYTAIFCND